jgi:hypothetical protein
LLHGHRPFVHGGIEMIWAIWSWTIVCDIFPK